MMVWYERSRSRNACNVSADGSPVRRAGRGLVMSVWSLAVAGGLMLGGGALAPAYGETLDQALAMAYLNNPQLDAQRAQVRAVDEQVPQTLSFFRPRVSASANTAMSRTQSEVGATPTSRGGNSTTAANTRSMSLDVDQSLYRGGRSTANVERAESQVQAARAQLWDVEQRVLLAAATAYTDVVRDQAVLKLNTNNEQVLRRQLEAAQDRFRVGEITRTDVSQAESRFARATAERVSAEGRLSASRANYTRVVGAPPGQVNQPKLGYHLPKNMDEAVDLARSANPAVIASTFTEKAARSQIEVVEGEKLPEVSMRASVGRDWSDVLSQSGNLTRQADRNSVTASVRAQVSLPLYTGGATESRIREAKQTANQRQIQVEDQRRAVTENAVRAWQQLVTSQAAIKSRRAQVKAAEVALEGVRQEATVGSRTVLDTLDAEQELLDARVTLVAAEHDEVVAAFTLMAAVGQLTASHLRLPVDYYDPDKNYKDVRGRWWGGTSID